MAGADEGDGVEAFAGAAQQARGIAPGRQIVFAVGKGHDTAADRRQARFSVQRRNQTGRAVRRRELGVIVECQDGSAMTQPGQQITAALHAEIGVDRQQRHVGMMAHRLGHVAEGFGG